MPFNWWMSKNLVSPHLKVLHSNKKEYRIEKCKDLIDSQGIYASWGEEKPVKKKVMYCMIPFM